MVGRGNGSHASSWHEHGATHASPSLRWAGPWPTSSAPCIASPAAPGRPATTSCRSSRGASSRWRRWRWDCSWRVRSGWRSARGGACGTRFRWALDTAATVGGFPQPHTTAGQIIQVALIVLGVGTLFYALATVTEFFVAGHLGELLAARRTQKMIDSLTDHHIICGFGRVGRQVARDLRAARASLVVMDSNTENRQLRREARASRFIEGDATEDEVLLQAGIERARSIIACADSDADNVFITLTARELRARHRDRGAGGRRGHREEAQARRRRPCDLPLQGQRHRDGAPGASPPAERRGGRGRGVPHGGDRRR